MKNRQKLFFIIFTLVFICVGTISVLANDRIFKPEKVRCNAYFINLNTGVKYKVKTKELPMLRSFGDDVEIGFKVEPTSDNLSLLYAPRSSGTQENEEMDDSASVSGIIKIRYSKRYNTNNEEEYLLTNISGSWKVWEPRGISLSNRHIAYTCQDAMNFDQVRLVKISSNKFSRASGFKKWTKEMAAGVLGASSFVTIRHGSESEWRLIVECNLFDNNILDIVGVSDFGK